MAKAKKAAVAARVVSVETLKPAVLASPIEMEIARGVVTRAVTAAGPGAENNLPAFAVQMGQAVHAAIAAYRGDPLSPKDKTRA